MILVVDSGRWESATQKEDQEHPDISQKNRSEAASAEKQDVHAVCHLYNSGCAWENRIVTESLASNMLFTFTRRCTSLQCFWFRGSYSAGGTEFQLSGPVMRMVVGVMLLLLR